MSRQGFVIGWLLALLAAVGSLFWYQDWLYQLPTPLPSVYKPVPVGTRIQAPQLVNLPADKPVFLHFFNPDCPCSRFNQPHIKALVGQFGRQVSFLVVVLSTKAYSPQQIRHQLGLDLPVLLHTSLASLCGVYATPQAVLLDTRHRLYYRGNYNRSRYCTDERTSYAKRALSSLLANQTGRVADARALTAYGCSLPACPRHDD
ncbi:DUF6436 domain-containing protein [Spirosoma rhododendri]|uniref:AhpC/TSA family protein n=1 Tax=Spirosoma rhododendri TaxID=2728024 RepID=A0A7L5DVI6_9BACT|nr:AhpC/TSA family protein [Spirosoma rhododendri]QJD81612.1 AhpC/TSA family protein [Spirosoma rhododendri]